MRREFACLTLPTVLCVLLLGGKWRAEQPLKRPKVTNEDLWIRSLLSKSRSAEIYFQFTPRRDPEKRITTISRAEIEPLIRSFYASQDKSDKRFANISKKGVVRLAFVPLDLKPIDAANIDVYINPDNQAAEICISRRNLPGVKQKFSTHHLHPYTIKYWSDFLIANPRISPELRARMKS